MKSMPAVALACLTAILIAVTASYAYLNRNRTRDVITVTGLAQQDFKADLIVWSGTFAAKDMVLKDAFQRLKKDRAKVRAFLREQGISEGEFVFSSVDINKEFDSSYDEVRGRTTQFTGYRLTQTVSIESNTVEQIEAFARDITELINAGVEIYSESPSYYYTKLGELKLEMLSIATANARTRAEKIVANSGGKLGKLKNARLGVFQIVAQNSSESYTWSGAYNTSSKNKTGAVTVKLEYALE
jgi:hypothetical protein